MISVCIQTSSTLSCISLQWLVLGVCSASAVALLWFLWLWLYVAMPRV